jgi:hypothetical protein
MVDNDKATHVTRHEFYGALVLIWLYIMLVIGDLLRIEWRWSTAILWVASFFVMVTYYVTNYRSRRASQGAEKRGHRE